MKPDVRRISQFLADPGLCRVVLLHGDDGGLVRERASALVRSVAGSLDDPFRVADLERERVSRLLEELAERPLNGGRRVVRVRDVTDAALSSVQAVLASDTEGLAVLEAGELTGRSRLRTAIEASAEGASIICQAERGNSLATTVTAMLRDHGLEVSSDVAAYVSERLGNDRGVTAREIEKLALYVHPHDTVGLSAAVDLVGDMAGLQTEDAVFGATEGALEATDRALGLALAQGASPITILRANLVHLQRLRQVKVAMHNGQPASEAIRPLRPPVFSRHQASFLRSVAGWSLEALDAACAFTWRAEQECKKTGAPASVLCRHVLLTISRRAAARMRA